MAPIPVPTPAPSKEPTPTPTPPVVVVPVVVVSSNMQMSGITADQFNTPAQTAAFATAVESSLTIDATVTNVVASNIVRRRLTHRTLLQSGVDVSYDLQVAIEAGWMPTFHRSPATPPNTPSCTGRALMPPTDTQITVLPPAGSSATAVFARAVADLTQAVTGDDSPLATALAEDLGVPVVLDTDAFVAPTSFTQLEIEVSTNVPTLHPAVMAPMASQTYPIEEQFRIQL